MRTALDSGPMSLRRCLKCQRHVRETTCPFCGASMKHKPSPPRAPKRKRRLARAAVLVAGSALAAVVPSQAKGQEPTPTPQTVQPAPIIPVPPYGVPVLQQKVPPPPPQPSRPKEATDRVFEARAAELAKTIKGVSVRTVQLVLSVDQAGAVITARTSLGPKRDAELVKALKNLEFGPGADQRIDFVLKLNPKSK